jgi:hypothetical protein
VCVFQIRHPNLPPLVEYGTYMILQQNGVDHHNLGFWLERPTWRLYFFKLRILFLMLIYELPYGWHQTHYHAIITVSSTQLCMNGRINITWSYLLHQKSLSAPFGPNHYYIFGFFVYAPHFDPFVCVCVCVCVWHYCPLPIGLLLCSLYLHAAYHQTSSYVGGTTLNNFLYVYRTWL